jgi:hypothetical protein
MAIIKFKRESEGVSVEINDVVTYISRSATIRTEPPSNFRIFADGQNLFLTLTDNTFFIDDIEQTDPTLSEITNVLRTSVFSDFPYKSHTAAELKAIKDASELVPGTFYKITDRGDRGLFFYAILPNELATEGTRLMLCPARYSANEVDTHGNSWKGVWNANKTVNIDDLVIWGGLVWKNLTGNIGDAPTWFVLGADYELIPKSSFTNNEYVEISFSVRYDLDNDWICKQWDAKNNIVGSDYAGQAYWWGNHDVNLCDVTDWNAGANPNGYDIFGNDCFQGIYNNSNTGQIYNNKTQFINNNSNTGGIFDNSPVSISGNSNGGTIQGNTNKGEIVDNTNGGLINSNSNLGYINANSNTGGITFNNNTLNIGGNSNSGDIFKNSNNGSIENIGPANGHIRYNVNNGDISVTTTGDITDAVVDK